MKLLPLILGAAIVCAPLSLSASTPDYAAEAENFIDRMPDGLQNRQLRAISRALHGDPGELAAVRAARNAAFSGSESVETVDIPSSPAMRLFRPKERASAPLPLLVYYHGGGWVLGSINSCSRFCDSLAATGRAMVLAVDYSLAPEHPFPQGLNDCVAAARYARLHATEWGSDPALVSLGGDSSGGNLALAAALSLTDAGDAAPASLILFYPVADANDTARSGGSWSDFGCGYGLDASLMEEFSRAYFNGARAPETKPWRHSPLAAPDSLLAGLPRTLIFAAGRDILLDQGDALAKRMKKAGAEVTRTVLPGAVHLFITVEGQPSAFGTAVGAAADFLNQKL